MKSLPPALEVLSHRSEPAAYSDEPRWPRRLLVFLAVFLPVLLTGQAYVWLREPLYESRATLLTVAPIVLEQPGIDSKDQRVVIQDQRGGTAEHVIIQQQMLLGPTLLQSVLDRLRAGGETPVPSMAELEAMLTATPFADTNVVELRARGPNEKQLPAVINAWLDVYQELRAREASQSENSAADALRLEIDQLETKVADKRQALDLFRRTHDILSKDEAGNQAVSELRGLNDALNKANDEETKAKARIDAARAAIARGESVAPPEERASLSYLEKRAQDLREKLAELKRRYTNSYIELQPQLKIIPEQLRETEKEIAQKAAQGQQDEIALAERAHQAARQTSLSIRAQIEAHKAKVAEFTTRFSQHEALQKELTDMEELYRKTQEQLLNFEVAPRDALPLLSVVDRASLPDAPVWPDYRRDSGIVVGISLALALFAVWLHEYLTHRPPVPGPALVQIPDIRVYSVPESIVLGRASQQPESLPERRTAALEQLPPRELSESELRMLMQPASIPARQLIGMLLSGATLNEAASLREEHIDLEHRRISPPSSPPRTLAIPRTVQRMFADHRPVPAWGDSDTEELEAHIACAAIDSGLPRPEEIDSAALRHTYIAYLVRQGIRLAELEHIVGPLPAKLLASYGRLSPAGPGLQAAAIDLVHPVLRDTDGYDKTL
ncbi:hypothetical protein [Methylococcus sp. EFPC2]|uniref:GumC family protein n=1 Tax=Methylococcus sp. EFPC2 TaxID=2812648 RepID=UPI0019689A5E|nr:hypothetical protein [Methylococcus sp. EFPC2]QSA98602.1 hypothetical protein JWZ97_07350 [Methylococcus sp. EFPC2]